MKLQNLLLYKKNNNCIMHVIVYMLKNITLSTNNHNVIV